MADLIDYTNAIKAKLDGKASTVHNHDSDLTGGRPMQFIASEDRHRPDPG